MSFSFLLMANPFSSPLYHPKMQDNLFSPAVNGSTTIEEFHVHFFVTSPLRIPRNHYKTHTHTFRRRNFRFTLVEFLPLLSSFPFLTAPFISMLLSLLPSPSFFYSGKSCRKRQRSAEIEKFGRERKKHTSHIIEKKYQQGYWRNFLYVYLPNIYLFYSRFHAINTRLKVFASILRSLKLLRLIIDKSLN